jgi:hypothetical protein
MVNFKSALFPQKTLNFKTDYKLLLKNLKLPKQQKYLPIFGLPSQMLKVLFRTVRPGRAKIELNRQMAPKA